jgi:rhamnosyltransferase
MTCEFPKIVVCIAAYNGMRWLPEQVKTILGQVDVDITVLVSVDLSTDGTIEYFRELTSKNKKIILLPYGVRYGSAAQNFFRLLVDVDLLGFDYVAFADQDDLWCEDKLKRAVLMLEDCQADGYSSNVIAFWEGGRRMKITKSQSQRKWDFLFESAGPGCTYVMRSNLIRRVKDCIKLNHKQMHDIGLHDWFVYAFARANGFKWIIDSYSGLFYRQHSNNEVGVNWGLRAYLFRFKKVLSGWGLRQSYLIARLIGLRENPFITRWSDMKGVGLIWLAFQARQCRRRFRDQILFSISCLSLAILSWLH